MHSTPRYSVSKVQSFDKVARLVALRHTQHTIPLSCILVLPTLPHPPYTLPLRLQPSSTLLSIRLCISNSSILRSISSFFLTASSRARIRRFSSSSCASVSSAIARRRAVLRWDADGVVVVVVVVVDRLDGEVLGKMGEMREER